jgi:hypothetical protein
VLIAFFVLVYPAVIAGEEAFLQENSASRISSTAAASLLSRPAPVPNPTPTRAAARCGVPSVA